MSVELLKLIFDWAAVVFVALTFIAGAGALITGNILNERQSKRLEQFEKELTAAKTELGKQQERAAKAESDLLALQERVKPRQLSHSQRQKMLEVLTSATVKGPTTVLALLLDEEGRAFAMQIGEVLRASGWHFENVGGYRAEGGISPVGVVILCRTGTGHNPPAHMAFITHAFSSAGIAPSVEKIHIYQKVSLPYWLELSHENTCPGCHFVFHCN